MSEIPSQRWRNWGSEMSCSPTKSTVLGMMRQEFKFKGERLRICAPHILWDKCCILFFKIMCSCFFFKLSYVVALVETDVTVSKSFLWLLNCSWFSMNYLLSLQLLCFPWNNRFTLDWVNSDEATGLIVYKVDSLVPFHDWRYKLYLVQDISIT